MPDGHGCCNQSTYHNQVHSAHCRREGGGISHHSKRAVGLSAAPDLWALTRSGSLSEVVVALAGLRRNGGNVNARNGLGVTALHLAVWRNHVPIIRHLLGAGADPNIRDGESGWSSLHRALHFGHLAAAGVLIAVGASLMVEDSKGRTPLDLLSVPFRDSSLAAGTSSDSLVTEVYSWGSGLNYQLGTGTTGIQHVPARVDSLQGLRVSNVAAAKFHSAALTTSGALYSWGFGRGGRLGHSDFHIHSGQTAVITPEKVCAGLGSRRVVAIGTAKHHTIVATESGEVYTWGSNREGRLGYPSVDTQPTPRRVTALRVKVVAVAAANKHSVALTDSGEVFTWGCNRQGQLGYGTSNSASNCVPRCVEFHASGKGKQIVAVAAAAAKYHTVILSVEGDYVLVVVDVCTSIAA
ncbi:hypothetical protein CBR_g37355 [Chara braunii]|uniref:RCC1-like domain-containing protein n=1 Tax=Chara braunii TaxID=69332 RepID=A0A388JZN3_CHABU|nr:hypothetical protein CBR_g37355 [Chara braunii]|eukprot:GBG63269.1 hypothetical protein CBR_g37355 [Chara braunii]